MARLPTQMFAPSVDRDIDDAIREALSGGTILFAGAGVSFLSKNATGLTIPDGTRLKTEFHEACGITGGRQYSLDRIAGFYVKKFGALKLFDWLSTSLTAAETNPDLASFYRLPWLRIYTTNYDDVIYKSRKGIANPSPIILRDPIVSVPASATIHLNGCIQRVAPNTIADDLILTDSSYAADQFSSSKWAQFFRSDLLAAKSILFVGYSLADLDIARILISEPALRRKTFFVISPSAEEIDRESLSEFGKVYACGVEFIFDRVRVISSTFAPSSMLDTFTSIEELGPVAGYVPEKNASVTLYEQLVYGTPAINELFSNVIAFSDRKYLVDRREVIEARQNLLTGPWKDVIITGEIASGKSFAALNLGVHLSNDGYRTFLVNDRRRLREDLITISRIDEKLCIIFDQYRNSIDEIEFFASQRKAKHIIIATERLSTHELFGDRIYKILGQETVWDVLLDRLSPADAAHFDEIINFTGLWGDLAGLAPSRRRDLIQSRYEGSLYKILLEVVRSKKVQDEIRRLFEPLRDDEQSLQFFIIAFVMSVLGYEFWINDWQSFYGIANLRRILAKHAEGLQHFILTDASRVRLRSGIISNVLLTLLADGPALRTCLVQLYARALEGAVGDNELYKMSIDLTRYNVIEPLFHGHSKLRDIGNYYEEIRPLGGTANKADYWLQSGIAATISNELDDAELAFQNAYAREKARPHPNLIRIDNYFSRYELQRALKSDVPDEAFRLFMSGSERLRLQIFMGNNRHYPFKTGRVFSAIAAKHYETWSDKQKKSFLSSTKVIHDKAIEWQRKNRATSVDVEILISESRKLLSQLGRPN